MLDLLTGGWAKIGALAASVAALLGYVTYLWGKASKSGENKKELEYARAERDRLARIKRAADAKPTHGVQSDPHNRDNRTRPG